MYLEYFADNHRKMKTLPKYPILKPIILKTLVLKYGEGVPGRSLSSRSPGNRLRLQLPSLPQVVKAVHGDVLKDLLRPIGPLHLYPVDALRIAQPEVQPQVALRQVAASAAHLAQLSQLARRHA